MERLGGNGGLMRLSVSDRVRSYHKVCFDPASGGEMIRQEYENFMKPEDSMDMAAS